jgi:hypothetical protein
MSRSWHEASSPQERSRTGRRDFETPYITLVEALLWKTSTDENAKDPVTENTPLNVFHIGEN